MVDSLIEVVIPALVTDTETEFIVGLNVGRCNLVWFNEDNPNYKVIKCADYSEHVDNMLTTLIPA